MRAGVVNDDISLFHAEWQQTELMLPVCLVQMRCLGATFLKRPVKEMWISMAMDFCTQRNWALHSL